MNDSNQQPKLKPGAIVRTPDGGPYGGRPALVLKSYASKHETHVTVSTGKAELVYTATDLKPLAHIVINVKRYGTSAGVRLNRCRVEFVSGRPPVTMDVVTRGKGALGEETRALEVRKLCFIDLTKGIYDVPRTKGGDDER